MNNCKIVEYTVEYSDKLATYMHRAFPKYNDQYIEYCVNRAGSVEPDDKKSLLVLNEVGEIVGCHLFYHTKVMIDGKEYNTRWGHDTILDEKYRKKIGFQFVVKIASIPAFGIGLSDVNREIQRKLKTAFASGLYNYCSVTPFFLLSVLTWGRSPICLRQDINEIRSGSRFYKKITCIKDMQLVPNQGYWGNGKVGVDFIRDESFFKDRFFENRVYAYDFYQLRMPINEHAYFVVRPIRFKGFKALFLVDFRYDIGNMDLLKNIFKAVTKLAMKNSIGVIVWMGKDEGLDKLLRHKPWVLKKSEDLFFKRLFQAVLQTFDVRYGC